MQEKEVDLRDYVRVIKKRKKTILLLFLVAVIATAGVNFFLPPVYEVTLAMKIGDIIDVDTLERELIESPIAASQFLEGPQILLETIKELKLPYTLEEFRKKILIEPVRETEDLVQVRVEVNSSGEAVSIANYLGAKLLERHKEIKKLYESKETILVRYDEQIKQTNEELGEISMSKEEILAKYDEQIRQINDELDKIDTSKETILAKYDEQIRQINEELDEIDTSKETILAGYDENIQSMNNQLTLLKNEIDEAKKEMVKMEVSLEALSVDVENKMKNSESLSEAEANMLIGRLNNMRSRWENYRGDVSEGRRRYDTLLEELRGIQFEKTEFEQTKDRRYDTLLEELRGIQFEKTEFEQTKDRRYDTLSGELRGVEQEKVKFQKTKVQRYDILIGQLRQSQMEKTRLERVDSVKMYNTEILVTPEEPNIPVRPNKLLNILVAAVVSLIIGLGLVFSLEYFQKAD